MNPIFDLIVIGVIVSMVLVNLYSVRESQNAVPPWTKLKKKLHEVSLWGQSPALSSFHGQARLSRD